MLQATPAITGETPKPESPEIIITQYYFKTLNLAAIYYMSVIRAPVDVCNLIEQLVDVVNEKL